MSLLRSLAVLILLASAAMAADRAKPNIILIVADDLGYGDVGAYGQERIATPRLDTMAKEGTAFTSAYAGSPVCAPSRYVLMTGRHTGHAAVRGNAGAAAASMPAAAALQPEDRTIAAVLKDAGYATGGVGKWGLGEPGPLASGMPSKQGFDYFFGYLNQTHAHNSYPTFLWRNDQKVELPNVVPNVAPNGTGVSSNRAVFAQDLFVEEALGFIRKNHDKPFFLYFTPTLPHANNESKPVGLEVPSQGQYAEKDWPETARLFAAMVTRLDHDVGRILDQLRELGLDRDTLVLFVSDNGPHAEGGQDPDFFRSSGGLRGIKRALYEGGIRVPAIARWPGKVPAGARVDTPWSFADLLPTLAAVGGGTAPASDGVNVWSAFMGTPDRGLSERGLYWEFYEGGYVQAARRGNWKAVRPKGGAATELYDLASDRAETRNVAAAHADVVKSLEAFMAAEHTPSAFWNATVPAPPSGAAR